MSYVFYYYMSYVSYCYTFYMSYHYPFCYDALKGRTTIFPAQSLLNKKPKMVSLRW